MSTKELATKYLYIHPMNEIAVGHHNKKGSCKGAQKIFDILVVSGWAHCGAKCIKIRKVLHYKN